MKTSSNIFAVVFLFVGLTTNLFAQKNKGKPNLSKTYNYSIVSNVPEDAPNLNIVLIPAYVNAYSLNLNLGYSAELSYRLNNKIGVNGFFSKSYLDRFNTTDGNSSVYHGFADEEQLGVTNYGFGGVFYFLSQSKKIDEEVTLKQSSNGSTTTRYIMKIPAQQLHLYGIRASYEVFNSPVYSKNGKIAFNGYPAPDSTGLPKDFSSGQFSTMMNSGTINFGISRTKISDLFVTVEEFGERQSTSVSEIYVDVMYATKITFADMLVSYQGYNWGGGAFFDQYQPYVINDNTLKSKIGFRLGYNHYVNDGFTFLGKFGAELGMRPGPKAGSDNFYLLIKFGLNFAAKVG